MQSIEDFTTLAAGTVVWPEGLVERCPKCGRTGVEQHLTEGGTRLFAHALSTEVIADGMIVEPRECCTVNGR